MVETGVLSGRVVFATAYQPLRSWLISGGRFATGHGGDGGEGGMDAMEFKRRSKDC